MKWNRRGLTWRRVRATNASITGPLSSFNRCTSSIIRSFTSIESDISLLLRVITSHFSGVVTIIWLTGIKRKNKKAATSTPTPPSKRKRKKGMKTSYKYHKPTNRLNYVNWMANNLCFFKFILGKLHISSKFPHNNIQRSQPMAKSWSNLCC